MSDGKPKQAVKAFWETGSAGEFWAVGDNIAEQLAAEISVGMGSDHLQWALAGPNSLAGIDLSNRSIAFTGKRLTLNGKTPRLAIADCETLPLADCGFDLVYSWGVLHHTPDTPAAITEAHRVLRPGGVAKNMIYHDRSLTGYMLWLRYGLLRGRPWISLGEIYDRYLESPGTKAYSVADARDLFVESSQVTIRV